MKRFANLFVICIGLLLYSNNSYAMVAATQDAYLTQIMTSGDPETIDKVVNTALRDRNLERNLGPSRWATFKNTTLPNAAAARKKELTEGRTVKTKLDTVTEYKNYQDVANIAINKADKDTLIRIKNAAEALQNWLTTADPNKYDIPGNLAVEVNDKYNKAEAALKSFAGGGTTQPATTTTAPDLTAMKTLADDIEKLEIAVEQTLKTISDSNKANNRVQDDVSYIQHKAVQGTGIDPYGNKPPRAAAR